MKKSYMNIDNVLTEGLFEKIRRALGLSTKQEKNKTLLQDINFSTIQLFNNNTTADTYALLKNKNTI